MLVSAGILLLGGCGGSAGATVPGASPSLPAASTTAFCAVFRDAPPTLAGPAGTARLAAAHELARALLATGVPSTMPDDARRGLAVYQQALAGADAAGLGRLLAAQDPSDVFPASTAGEVAAYVGYVRTTCITHATLAPTPSPSLTPRAR